MESLLNAQYRKNKFAVKKFSIFVKSGKISKWRPKNRLIFHLIAN
jgi:hypothetical protein